MIFNLLNLIKDMLFFTGSYSNNVFPDPLTSEEEEKYLRLMQEGNKEARNILIERNLRLVAHIVKKFESKNYDNDDLISIGTIGLIKGIDSYSYSKSTKITTYAARCIENEILMHFRATKKHNNNISLNHHYKEDIALQLHTKNNLNLLFKYLDVLSDREKLIIIKRYGLFNEKEKTQKEIAKELKISRSYVSRIEKRALSRLLKEFIQDCTSRTVMSSMSTSPKVGRMCRLYALL